MTVSSPKNILIVRIGMAGDTLFTFPLIKTLRRANPSANITAVVSPKGSPLTRIAGKEIGLSETITYDFYHPKIAKWWTRKKLNGRRFDEVFILDTHLEYLHFFKSLITGTRWYRMVAQPDDLGGAQFVQNAVGKTRHIARQYLQLAEAAGIETLVEDYSFLVPDAARQSGKKLLQKYNLTNQKTVVFHWGNHSKNTNILFPKEGFDGRAWSMDSFAKLGEALQTEFPGITILLTGGPYERRLITQLQKKMSLAGIKSINIAGKTNRLLDLIGLLSMTELVVVGDTGPMHFASAIGTPTIALFFAANPYDTGPYNAPQSTVIQSPISCAPCVHTPKSYQCPTNTNCVKSLPASIVIDHALGKLKAQINK